MLKSKKQLLQIINMDYIIQILKTCKAAGHSGTYCIPNYSGG